MEKRRQNILIWLITWASLLLLVLYSPIGSPDLYEQNGYAVTNQSVYFKGGEINNSSGIRPVNQSNKNNINIPVYSGESKNATKYSISSSGGRNSSNSTGAVIPNSSDGNNHSTQNGNGLDGFSGGLASSRNSGTSGIQNDNLISMSTDLTTLADNNTFRQGLTQDDPLGTTDPGGEPIGDPIPVGDGWIFLLLLAFSYGLIKKFFFNK